MNIKCFNHFIFWECHENLYTFFRQREIAIQNAVHQLSQSERWNNLAPLEQQQVIKVLFFSFV